MIKKLAATFAALMLGLMLAGPALAVDPPDKHHLAGKPISGVGFAWWGPNSTCHGSIYGRVNGDPVLFIPFHCYKNGLGMLKTGLEVKGPNGTRIGEIGPSISGIVNSETDFAWIKLDAGNWPDSGRNMVWVGGQQKWQTREAPSTYAGCGPDFDLTDQMRVGYFQLTPPYANEPGIYDGPWNGNVTSIDQSGPGCNMITNFTHPLGDFWVPSGAPLWDQHDDEFVGDAVGVNGSGKYFFSSWRKPIRDLRDLYGHDDTFFCANSACTNT